MPPVFRADHEKGDYMSTHRLLVAGLSLAVSLPVYAQSAGNVEIGGFGQFVRMDGAWHVKNGWGGGGRLGVFLTRRFEFEATAGFSSSDNEPPRAAGTSSGQTFTGQLNYNLPFGMGGRTHALLLEAGAGAQRFAGHTDFTLPLGGGIRWMLSDALALRFDGIVQYVENPTAATFDFPLTIGRNRTAARSSNVEIRAGLSFLLGNRKAEEPPPPAPTPARQIEAQPPRTEPTPTPVRVEPTPTRTPPQPNRDSIAAVDRSRAALLAKVFFDFDKAELRADQRAVLDAKLPVLRANPAVRIRIEGNADERGSDEYNMALGMRRAQTARQYLIDHGVDASRIDISSNGEEKPVCQEHDESCWSQNRRDEFVIVAGEIRVGG
jgi:peptidoglycan-associated lipoprotein